MLKKLKLLLMNLFNTTKKFDYVYSSYTGSEKYLKYNTQINPPIFNFRGTEINTADENIRILYDPENEIWLIVDKKSKRFSNGDLLVIDIDGALYYGPYEDDKYEGENSSINVPGTENFIYNDSDIKGKVIFKQLKN